jgi:hypothetical protein
MTAADLVEELRSALSSESGPGFLFGILLRDQPASPEALSKAQQSLVRQMEELRAAIARAWLTRGIGEKTLPPRSALFERVAWSDRVRASVCTHAEAIALEGVLSPEQADRVVVGTWKTARLLALTDPQLASRLPLTRRSRSKYASCCTTRLYLETN